MAKLYFKYGAMGSSKSAQALITQFNYEELGMTVWLIKPSVDDRDGANIIRSRIGLQREAQVIHPNEDIIATFARAGHADVIIADEAQFFSPEQIDQLRRIVDEQNIPVLCFGLLTGATLGGNLTPIGASANIAAIGILRKQGEQVRTRDFLRIGIPFTLAAVLTGYVYLWLVWGA